MKNEANDDREKIRSELKKTKTAIKALEKESFDKKETSQFFGIKPIFGPISIIKEKKYEGLHWSFHPDFMDYQVHKDHIEFIMIRHDIHFKLEDDGLVYEDSQKEFYKLPKPDKNTEGP